MLSLINTDWCFISSFYQPKLFYQDFFISLHWFVILNNKIMAFCCCEPFTCARILTGIELGLTILSVYGSFSRVGIIGGNPGIDKVNSNRIKKWSWQSDEKIIPGEASPANMAETAGQFTCTLSTSFLTSYIKVWGIKKVSRFWWKFYFTKSCPILYKLWHFLIKVSGKNIQKLQQNRKTFLYK